MLPWEAFQFPKLGNAISCISTAMQACPLLEQYQALGECMVGLERLRLYNYKILLLLQVRRPQGNIFVYNGLFHKRSIPPPPTEEIYNTPFPLSRHFIQISNNLWMIPLPPPSLDGGNFLYGWGMDLLE